MQNLRNAEAPATSAREGRDVTLGRGMALGVKLPIWRSDPLSIERTITRTRTRLFDAWSLSRNLLGFYGGGARRWIGTNPQSAAVPMPRGYWGHRRVWLRFEDRPIKPSRRKHDESAVRGQPLPLLLMLVTSPAR